ncbi:hypothetical protein JZ751_019666 [Albula glossodonta]|uniref:Phosphopantothenoylcysteine decarboxylase n=1 Tax=Albula glossodonta TaxID=121402 RepID=A0A8T2NLF6_9TELE|nr:hypothetical protein JZ751_019666 [Albula glossodonta]
MNTAMWQHPITAKQVAVLKEFGYIEVPCIAKKLVCGDEAMATESSECAHWSATAPPTLLASPCQASSSGSCRAGPLTHEAWGSVSPETVGDCFHQDLFCWDKAEEVCKDTDPLVA